MGVFSEDVGWLDFFVWRPPSGVEKDPFIPVLWSLCVDAHLFLARLAGLKNGAVLVSLPSGAGKT